MTCRGQRLDRLLSEIRPPKLHGAGDSRVRALGDPSVKHRPDSIEQAWSEWIHSVAQWTIMVTITFKQRGVRGYKISQVSVEKALRRLVRLINCDLFGKRRANKGWTVACAVTADLGPYSDHLHAHLLIAAPDGVSEMQLCAAVERAALRTSIVNRERRYRKYFSAGGAEYLVKHGTDRMVVPLLTPKFEGQ